MARIVARKVNRGQLGQVRSQASAASTTSLLPAADDFCDRHIGPRKDDQKKMLESLGYEVCRGGRGRERQGEARQERNRVSGKKGEREMYVDYVKERTRNEEKESER